MVDGFVMNIVLIPSNNTIHKGIKSKPFQFISEIFNSIKFPGSFSAIIRKVEIAFKMHTTTNSESVLWIHCFLLWIKLLRLMVTRLVTHHKMIKEGTNRTNSDGNTLSTLLRY